jgi:two-component system sensor histidine kinase TctE
MSAPREQRSLFGEILDWMLAPLLLLWPMSLGLTGLVAQEIANRPYDRELGELARLLARQVVVQAPAQPAQAPQIRLSAAQALEVLRLDDADRVYLQVLGARGELVAGDRDLPLPDDAAPPPTSEPRFRDAQMRDEPVRVAYLLVPLPRDMNGNPVLVQFAETLDKRSRLATEIIKGVILPQFVILPIAVLLVWLALSRGIRPLHLLQQRIRQREAGDLSPIDQSEAPEEVAPLVTAINGVLARLQQSMATQKQFLADAAHQLKTPLAGLRMQAEIALREIDAGEREPQSLRACLQQIARSSERAAHTVNQLLAMARAEDREPALRPQAIDLSGVVQEALRDLVPRALDKRIDLGYEGPVPGGAAPLAGQPVLVGELVRNLVDNAIKYTPAGGTVTVRIVGDARGREQVLQVEDNGPGIPLPERERIFQPFYRVLGTGVDGTGLGLPIVQEIARRHGADVALSDGAGGQGALFTVRFPLPAG